MHSNYLTLDILPVTITAIVKATYLDICKIWTQNKSVPFCTNLLKYFL